MCGFVDVGSECKHLSASVRDTCSNACGSQIVRTPFAPDVTIFGSCTAGVNGFRARHIECEREGVELCMKRRMEEMSGANHEVTRRCR